jgi:hypothetical protein
MDRYGRATPDQRLQLVQSLGGHGDAVSRRLLGMAMNESNERVVATAAGMLARLGGEEANSRVLALLQRSPSKSLRYQVASTIRWSNPRLYKQHKRLIDQIYQGGR